MGKLPPGLADVVGPLQEAETYARLQGIRQLGLYNVLTGLPGFLFIFPWWIPMLLFAGVGHAREDDGVPQALWSLGIQSVIWIAFFLACFPKVFLPLVRRYRPDWQSPLLESSLLKRGLEKQFWLQFPFWMAYTLLMPLVLVVFLVASDDVQSAVLRALGQLTTLSLLVGLVLHCMAVLLLAWQARRANDLPLRWTFLAMLPLAAVPLFVRDQVPSLVGMAMMSVALVAPPIIVGLVRLLAPRRWLVD